MLTGSLIWVSFCHIVFCLSRLCFLSVIIRTQAAKTFFSGEWPGVFEKSAGIGNYNRDNLRTTEPLMGIVFHYSSHRCITVILLVALWRLSCVETSNWGIKLGLNLAVWEETIKRCCQLHHSCWRSYGLNIYVPPSGLHYFTVDSCVKSDPSTSRQYTES